MPQILKLVTPPASEPITLAQFKTHARIVTAQDDTYISTVIIPSARRKIENELRKVLITQTWTMFRDNFPGFDPRYERSDFPTILLPNPPFQSIVSFQYYDTFGVLQALTQTQPNGEMADPTIQYGYQLDPGSGQQPCRLDPPWAKPWPPARRMPLALQITFVAGYGPFGSPVNYVDGGIPDDIINAIYLQGAHLYFNREAITETGGKELARGVSSLLNPYINRLT